MGHNSEGAVDGVVEEPCSEAAVELIIPVGLVVKGSGSC